MKTNPVKKALREGKPQVGTWLSLGSVVAARFLARTGLPWLTVDMEHLCTDIHTAAMMFGAIADAGYGSTGAVSVRTTPRPDQVGPRLRRDGDRRADGDGRQ